MNLSDCRLDSLGWRGHVSQSLQLHQRLPPPDVRVRKVWEETGRSPRCSRGLVRSHSRKGSAMQGRVRRVARPVPFLPLVPCECPSPPNQVAAVAPPPGKSVGAVTGRMYRIPGLEECASHHPQHGRLIIHHEHDPGMRENLAVSHGQPRNRRASYKRVSPSPPQVGYRG